MLNISIAIPDSSLVDESTKLDKSRKISLIARACSIFKVNSILIYKDGNFHEDRNLIVTILRYLVTPPYLRKKLFPKISQLKYAGVLHPLKIQSHTVPMASSKIKTNDYRDGVVIGIKGRRFVDSGLDRLIPYNGNQPIGKRITIQFKTGYPDFSIKEIEKDKIPNYWGYKIQEKGNLFSLLTSWQGLIILTSRKGKQITKTHLEEYAKSEKPILIVFGSPEKGIHDILGNKIKQVQNAKVLNFFPDQATETVRLEEAILGTLSILNLSKFN